jgi:predicted ester cyclase
MSTASEPDLAVTARGALQFVCSGQLDRVADFYDERFVDHVNGMIFRGHAGARESVEFYRSLLGDIHFDIDDQVTEGDRVATRWTMHGTYRRRPIALHGVVISRFRDGRIVEDYSVTDSLELPRALGVARTLLLGVDIVRGRIKPPRGALRGTAGDMPIEELD